MDYKNIFLLRHSILKFAMTEMADFKYLPAQQKWEAVQKPAGGIFSL